MLIGVISDTHGLNSTIETAVAKMGPVDVIIHLGDCINDVKEIRKHFNGVILKVKGNCDCGLDSNELVEVINGKKILMTHGHKYNVKEGLNNLMHRAMELNVDIVLFGHTHLAYIELKKNIWFINPGSTKSPANGKPSVAIIEINNDVKPCILAI